MATKIPIVINIDVWNFPCGLILKMNILFINIESTCEFIYNFVAICSTTQYPFVFPPKRKQPPLDILKSSVNKWRNQYKKASFICLYRYGALERSSGFMRTCHTMIIIVQTTSGDTYSLKGKFGSPNKKLADITRDWMMIYSHKKELWWLAYKYDIFLSHRT